MRQRTVGLIFVIAGTAVVAAMVAAYVVGWLMKTPETVSAASVSGKVELRLQTVASLGPRFPNPSWVSYLTLDDRGEWRHTTNLQLPANTTVEVTIEQYDTGTGLRNPFFAQPQGVGGFAVDGTSLRVVDPGSVAHTFAIPGLGVYVPLPGVGSSAPNQCAAAPCSAASAHRTVTFTLRTGKPGRYRWQCFVPCGAGFVVGFGGPMQTIGYMDGFLEVV